MKKVLVLKGIEESGKTTILKKLMEWFEKTYPNSLLEKEYFENSRNYKEVIAQYEIQGLKIGVFTKGDYYYNTKNALDKFVNDQCDIFILACRRKTSSNRAVNEFIEKYEREKNESMIVYKKVIETPSDKIQDDLILNDLKTVLRGINGF